MYRKILIASDGSDGARKALSTAIELSKCLGAAHSSDGDRPFQVNATTCSS